MMISDILSDEGIDVDLKSCTKKDVINELVDLLNKGHKLDNINEIRQAILEREELSSTGICNGLAIPHAKVNGIKQIMGAIGLSKSGIDYQAMDDTPSQIFFVLISPKENQGTHVKTLAKITKILRKEEWRQELLKCQNADDVMDFIIEKEKNI